MMARRDPLMKKMKRVKIITTDRLIPTNPAAFVFRVAVAVGVLDILAYSLRR
jgi:hypothetical protein